MILFAKAQIIGGIVPNLIAFGLFLGAIGYFSLTGRMAEMFGWKTRINKYRSYDWTWCKIPTMGLALLLFVDRLWFREFMDSPISLF